MNLNDIYQRYGVAIQRAHQSSNDNWRLAQLKVARRYAETIRLARLHGTEGLVS